MYYCLTHIISPCGLCGCSLCWCIPGPICLVFSTPRSCNATQTHGVYKATTFFGAVHIHAHTQSSTQAPIPVWILNNINILQILMHTIPYHLIPEFTALQCGWHWLPHHCGTNSHTLTKIWFFLLSTETIILHLF